MSKREHLVILFLLAVTIWAARYARSAEFGLYEDDYTYTPRALAMGWGDLAKEVAGSFNIAANHGKLLHTPVILTLNFLGGKLNGLQGVYWVGFAICVLNAWLFYWLLRRVGPPLFALIGGLAYSLYSADTTQALLTNALGLQTSLTFLLLAFHSYLSGRKWVAYGLAGLILISYEVPFPVFLGAPLLAGFLQPEGRPAGWKEWVRHAAILAGMLLLAALIRRLAGESRVAGLDLETIVRTPLTQMVLGTWTSLKLFLLRNPVRALTNRQVWQIGWMVGLLILHGAALWLASSRRGAGEPEAIPQKAELDIKQELMRLLTGVALLALAYALAFTIPATEADGRDSRVHLAAVVGTAWLVGWGGTLLLNLVRAYGGRLAGALRLAGIAILAAFFALQVGYGALIQRDYAASWQYQRQFWTQLLPLITDMEDGDIILVEPSVTRATGQIGVITWNTPRVLQQIYRFPAEWQALPRVYRLEGGWEQRLISPEGLVQINQNTLFIPESMYVDVESEQVIFIEVQDERLVRHNAPLLLNGTQYPVKQQVPTAGQPFAPGELYHLMILSP